MMKTLVARTLAGEEVGRVTEAGDVATSDPVFRQSVESPNARRSVRTKGGITDLIEEVPKESPEWFAAVHDTLVRTGKWIVSVGQ